VKNSLKFLPCFDKVDNISEIHSGLSQRCFKIIADNKCYFAKTISNNTEVLVNLCANDCNLSPTVIYHDDNWLISQFIDGSHLGLSTLSIHKKIEYTIQLMVQCHQLPDKPPELSVKNVINDLVNKPYYSTQQINILIQLSELITLPLQHIKKGVCCHGDLNFTNVLIDQKHKTWLVDYECACTAPIEFDIAMCISVNNLNSNELTTLIEQYESQSALIVNPKQLNHYLLFCYLLNTLWYFNTYKETEHIENKSILLKNAKQQCLALQSSLTAEGSSLLSSLSIKLTDILTTFNLNEQT